MIVSSAVTVVVNGAIVAGFTPARVVRGRVVAPLSPIVIRLASRAAYEPAMARVVIERGSSRIVVPVAFVEDATPFVDLGPIVRGLGGSAVFDTASKTLTIVLQGSDEIVTPAPFAPGSAVSPGAVFTPAPRTVTPRSTETGIPRPRRTAIPVTPSQPVVPPPQSAPTDPHR
jgi:hypothetical protein